MKCILLAALAVVCMVQTASAVNCTNIKSCKECVEHFKCYWCVDGQNSTKGKTNCHTRTTFQLKAECNGKYYFYPTCSLTGQTMLILLASGLGVFVILLGVLIYCCCCRSSSSSRFRRDDERDRTLRTERTRRQEERRQERQTRIDDIRKKYGLGTDERYQKM